MKDKTWYVLLLLGILEYISWFLGNYVMMLTVAIFGLIILGMIIERYSLARWSKNE